MMFADRARYPHPHQLASPLYSTTPSLGHHDGQFSSFQDRAKDGQFLPNAQPQKIPQKPPHYILPLQHAQSRSNHPKPKAITQAHTVNSSEHMLRRKTPNGTLSAGYDGTPVEWISRPHASKQFLVPNDSLASNHLIPNSNIYSDPAGVFRGQPFAIAMDNMQQNTWPTQSPSFKQRVDSAVMTDDSLGKMQWLQHDMRPPSIDSVLHQVPMNPQSFIYNGYPQVPTALQPMWPVGCGPTASNAQFSIGPYWPDGSFEPYRPSALRDQFNAQFANINLNGFPEFQGAHDRQQWSRRSAPNTRGAEMMNNSFQSPPDFVPRSDVSRSYSECFSARRSRAYQQPLKQVHAGDAAQAASVPFRETYPSSRTDAYRNDGLWTAPCPSTTQFPISPPLEGQASISPQQAKTKVLAWAHRVYVNLVYHSKKNAMKQSGDKGHTRASIFPKPPAAASQPPSSSRDGLQRSPALTSLGRTNSQERYDYAGNHPDVASNNSAHPHWPATKSRSTFHERHDRGLRLSEQNYINAKGLNIHPSLGFIGNPSPFSAPVLIQQHFQSPSVEAQTALDTLDRMCQESGWQWIDGILLGGCLAYGLEQFEVALSWYSRVLQCDPNNVEAISNTAATFLALKQRKEAETRWYQAVWLRPRYFEAVEHLVGLLCADSRGREAIKVIEHVEEALKISEDGNTTTCHDRAGLDSKRERPEDVYAFDADKHMMGLSITANRFGSSGYQIPSSDNGRLLALVHAKGNLLYATGNNAGAAKAFEDAVMIVTGRRLEGINGLIKHILGVFADQLRRIRPDPSAPIAPCETILLHPHAALKTAEYVFPQDGQLPGLRDIVDGQPKRAAISVASNSLLSLAKIYQDGMSSSGASPQAAKASPGVQDILALYYLSLSLQPSPSTANNIGILLASVQHSIPHDQHSGADKPEPAPTIPGVRPGSGIALALSYYNYGLNLDNRHAHLYTNLGSLLKDIGQLNAAIKMYEQAVACDGNFDIALANLANAVKDQGRISDAIGFYKRAVNSNPEFAEAVCGLANALNSVCCWKGRGGVIFSHKKYDRWHVDEQGMLQDGIEHGRTTAGWTGRVVSIVEKQLKDGQSWGRGILRSKEVEQLFTQQKLLHHIGCDQATLSAIFESLNSWSSQDWEGARLLRLLERVTRRLGWRAYQDKHVKKTGTTVAFTRPRPPASLSIPSAPTVLPFHTFTCPLTASQVRKISQRNGLRISCSTLKAPWLSPTIFEPPAPPNPQLRVGYVSSDFNNHPLAHLMQSVFGFHDRARVTAFCYATTASDGSPHREQIQREAPVFHDAALWPTDRLVRQIVDDGIHILINLNGYTRGARNEVFAARPAPVQMSFMGFAGTLGAEWCDYLLADQTAVPPSMLRPYRQNVSLLDQTRDNNFGGGSGEDGDWVYGENIIFARDTFFCCDHRQSAPDSQEAQLSWPDEQERRRKMRKELFPNLADDVVIMGNFNQLYKIEPTTFRTWLRILQAVPKAVLWLLRFPDLGETNLRATAEAWASPSVAERLVFTDVAPKHQHIARARVCDLFLDTPECNAHTTAADVLWSGTPLLTLPRYPYKMCSRMAASILRGALPRGPPGDQAARELVASGEDDYEARAASLGNGLARVLCGEAEGCRLLELRRTLYEGRWTSALFDTRRWTRDLEEAYEEAWRRWVADEGGDIWL